MLAIAAEGSLSPRWLFFAQMTPSEFRNELLRLSAERNSEGVLRLHENHAAEFAGQLSPEEFEEVYGVALTLAHFRLYAIKQLPELAMRLGLVPEDPSGTTPGSPSPPAPG